MTSTSTPSRRAAAWAPSNGRTPAEKILSGLERVRRVGPDRHVARCPAHEDRSPSLGIRELDDGRVLLRCFAGCGIDEIVAAIGLSVADLFPPNTDRRPDAGTAPVRRPWTAADLLQIAAFECSVVAVVAADIARGEDVTDVDLDRVAVAAARLAGLVEAADARG